MEVSDISENMVITFIDTWISSTLMQQRYRIIYAFTQNLVNLNLYQEIEVIFNV